MDAITPKGTDMTTFQFTKKLINETEVNGLIAKHEIKIKFMRQYGSLNGLTTVYTYISTFLRAGYLKATQSPAFYSVIKHTDGFYELSDLKQEFHVNKEHVKTIVETVEEKQVGGTHYKMHAYQPIKLICLCDLSFIQGNIVKYILRYRLKNGAEDIEKVKHYSEFAIAYNHAKWVKSTSDKEVYEFCKMNELDATQIMVIRLATENKYRKIIDICDSLLVAL
jgi:hypothetical protein